MREQGEDKISVNLRSASTEGCGEVKYDQDMPRKYLYMSGASLYRLSCSRQKLQRKIALRHPVPAWKSVLVLAIIKYLITVAL